MDAAKVGVPSSTPNADSGGEPPIPSVLSQQGGPESKPSFVFKSAKGLGTDGADAAPSLPLTSVQFASLPPAPGGGAPRVGSQKTKPTFLKEIIDDSEDAESRDVGSGKSKDALSNPGQPANPRKKQRPPSLVLASTPGLKDLENTEFVFSGNENGEEKSVEAEEPAKKPVDDEEKNPGGVSTDKKAPHAAPKKDDLDALCDEIIADHNKSNKQSSSESPSSTDSKQTSGSPPVKADAGMLANPGTGSEKEVKPAAEPKSDKPALPVSTPTPQPSKAGSEPPPPPQESSKKDAPPPNPQAKVTAPTPGLVSSFAPQPNTNPPKLDPFDSVGSKKRRMKKDSDDEPDTNIDGTASFKSTKLKKSPRSAKSDKKKRRSQRDPVLTLQPRYVPQPRERKVPAQAQAALEQCQSLLTLLEEGCGIELSHSLLGVLVEMVFEVPEQNRAEVLERAWRCARALPDSQLRQWAHQALAACEKVRVRKDDSSDDESGASNASYSDAMQAYSDLCREVKTAANQKRWNNLAKLIAGKKLDAQTRLMATAVAIDSLKGFAEPEIGKAINALKTKLGAKLLILAFFQSTACPGMADLHGVIAHTPSAVLRGILAGDEDAIADFEKMVRSDSIPTGLETALIACADELIRQRGSGQQSGASPAPVTTSASLHGASSSTSSTSGLTPFGASALQDTKLDIVLEMLLLQGQTDLPHAIGLPDETICSLIALLECDRDEALRIVSSVYYETLGEFIHTVCESALTPLSCGLLLKSSIADAQGNRVPSLLRHMVVDGNVNFAREYLKKLEAAGISKADLVDLLRSVDNTGVTTLEAAISKGRDGNVANFVRIVSELTGLTPPEKLLLLEAKRVDSTPALLGAMQAGGAQLEKNVYAYVQGLLKFFNAKYIREVLAVLSAPDKEGNPPLRLALMNENAGVVVSMVRAICEDGGLLDPAEKMALLSGDTPETDGAVGYMEAALTEYYQAVKAKYQEKFPNTRIPKETDPRSGKTVYFGTGEDAFDKALALKDGNRRHLRDEARAKSQHAMMSKLTESERQDLKNKGQHLMRGAQAKAVPAFHMALRKGKAQLVAAYIKTIIEYAGPQSNVSAVNCILAIDANGNSALFNAMANDEAGAVEAYVDAVLASALPIDDKYRLLLQNGEVPTRTTPKKISPLQVAMGSLHYRAMHAYITAVLRSSLQDDDKQQLLDAVGLNGKSARNMVAELAQKAPQTHGKCLQMFDELINESTLKEHVKKYLTKFYIATSAAKKS